VEHSASLESNRHLASEEIPALNGIRTFITMLQETVTGQYLEPLHTFPTCFCKVHSNILWPRSSELFFPISYSHQNSVCISHLSHVCYMTIYLIPLDLITIKYLVKCTVYDVPRYAGLSNFLPASPS